MSQQPARYYEFGEFKLDALKRLLFKNGETVKLPPKAFDLLLLLIQHRDTTLSKDQLIERLWPDVAVEENNLTKHISFIRKMLGERLHDRKYIVTISGQGYRFVGDVREVAAGSGCVSSDTGASSSPVEDNGSEFRISDGLAGEASNRPLRLEAKTIPASPHGGQKSRYLILALLLISAGIPLAALCLRKLSEPPAASLPSSIAVLPFKVLNDQNCNNPFGVKMADAVITRFGSGLPISVRPTNDIIKYTCRGENLADIGRELKVDFLLEGKIQNYGGNVRMTAQIIRVNDGQSMWTSKFDQSYTDCFSVQDELSVKMTQDLSESLSRLSLND